MKIPKYYRSEKHFKRIWEKLKQCLCPHCKQYGFLILHGYLYGNPEDNSQDDVLRGHRTFCSNRRQKGGNGCGGTISILSVRFIKSFTITTKNLWRFLKNLQKGKSVLRAFGHSGLSHSSVYHIYQRFKANQSFIRMKLLPLSKPPDSKDIRDPIIETISHLELALKSDPLMRFQGYFQSSIL